MSVQWSWSDIDDGWAATINGVYVVIYAARGEYAAEVYRGDRVQVCGVWDTLAEAQQAVVAEIGGGSDGAA